MFKVGGFMDVHKAWYSAVVIFVWLAFFYRPEVGASTGLNLLRLKGEFAIFVRE